MTGASFFIMLFFPLFVVYAVFDGFFGYITGTDQTKIALPYNPESGIVWEYDSKDDKYIKLHDTVIEGNEQIFCFRKNGSTSVSYNGMWMDLIFTDKNGNSLKYYMRYDTDGELEDNNQEFIVLAPGEYLEYEYTATPETPASFGGNWTITYLDAYRTNLDVVYMPKQERNDEESFKLVFKKSDAGKSRTTKLLFSYGTIDLLPSEELTVTFEITDSEVNVISEEYEYVLITEN